MKICIYGASSNTIDPIYIEAGEKLGRLMAEAGHTLVYGGGATGLMGAVSRGALEQNGTVIGVSPKFFDLDGILEKRVTEMVFTETMRERKDYMEQISDAFIVTPGGIGTYEEFFETYTLRQLGQLPKPIAILNTKGYYNPMLAMLQFTADQGFMYQSLLNQLIVGETPEEILEALAATDPEAEKLSNNLEEHCSKIANMETE